MNKMMQTGLLVLAAAVLGLLLYWRVDIFHRGGPIMVLIIMGSVFAGAIIFERFYYFFSLGSDPGQFLNQLRTFVHAKQWKEARTLCDGTNGPVARMTQVGLTAHNESAEEIEEIMEEAAHEELPQVERHHRWLATIAQVSTLLGLLGTVVGMVVAFQVIQSKATSTNPVSPADLAGGIWQALITTAAGLSVAIPTILAYNYLASRVTDVEYQMEKATAIVMHWRRAGEHASREKTV